jgi:NAD(P)-dependent dehydrogenase (short-subunit alcohol dehydrogenase family)
MRLKGKAAIVTGAAQGIGREYALRFAREGAAVAIVDLRQQEAEATAKDIREAGGLSIAMAADVTDESKMSEAAGRVAEEFGTIDVLVNNAALYGDMNIGDQSVEYFLKVLNTNVLSVIVATRAAFPYLKRQGGSIINVSSTAAYPLPIPRMGELQAVPISGYSVSKSAVINVTKWFASILGPMKIRVNAIAPGLTMSEATKKVVPDIIGERITEATALGLRLDPTDLTGTAVYLASDDSALMTGQVLVVDGGLVMLG